MRRSYNLLSYLSGMILCVLLPVVPGCGGGNNAEQTTATWKKTFGGPGVNYGTGIQQTADGGYITVGQTNSFGAGQWDVYLTRMGADGDVLWAKTFGGPADDSGASVQQTTDGGYIIAGQTNSFGMGKYDIYLIKTDANGNEQWTKSFGGPEDDIASSVLQTGDGGYIIVGTTGAIYASRSHTNVYLVKTDSAGNAVWTKTLGESLINSGNAIQQTGDGGYLVTGTTFDSSSGPYGTYTARIDQQGNLQWARTFKDSSQNIMGISLQQTNDGGCIILGEYNSGTGNGDAVVLPMLMRMDSGGTVLWTKILDVAGMRVASFYRTADNGFIIAGTTGDSLRSSIYLIRTDSGGNILWSKTLAGSREQSAGVQQTSDGGYVIIGGTLSYSNGLTGVLVIKTNRNGDF